MQACRLASPSDTKRILALPSFVSGIKPPETALLRIFACCAPSHPFGWLKTNWISRSTALQSAGPLAWVSIIKFRVHRYKSGIKC